MKKCIFMVSVTISSLMFSSCGTIGQSGTSGIGTSSQTGGLSGVLGNLGGLQGIGEVLSGVLGVTTQDIVGTWTYQEPAVLFESDNMLAKAGGQLAAKTVESKLKTDYEKVGIKSGLMTMTFDRSGNFSQTVSGKTQSGTYTVNNGAVNLTYSGGTQQIVGTTQFDGNNLVIVMDVTKLLNFAKTAAASSNNQTLNGISSIANSFSGMKGSLKFKK